MGLSNQPGAGTAKKIWPRKTSRRGHCSPILLLSNGKIHTFSKSSGAPLEDKGHSAPFISCGRANKRETTTSNLTESTALEQLHPIH